MELNFNNGDIYAILTAICWSSAVILFEFSSRRLSSIQINILKNLIGILGFFFTIFFTNTNLLSISMNHFLLLVFSGFTGVALGDLFFLSSLRMLGSGLSAIIGTFYSPAIILFAFIMYGEIIENQFFLGATLVIIGIIIGNHETSQVVDSKRIFVGVIFGILAQVLTAYSVLLLRPIMDYYGVVDIAIVRFATGFIFSITLLVFKNGRRSLNNTFKAGFRNVHLISGALLGTYLSVIFWLLGFKYTLAGKAAIYNQLSTIFIIILATIFLKESMNLRKWLAVFLSICGALLVSFG
tara:strand:+ start:2344 stop:3231 length:888 start_codon:yes stop_codon:yes gene_type:complete